jgi:hypothetical protein
MAAGIRIFFVDRAGQHLDRPHEQVLVFVGGALQVFDELFQFVRHGVECGRQFANFGAGFQVHALREIAARNGPAGLRQHLQWAGDPPRRENAQAHAHKHRQPRQQAPGALHLVDAAIGFFARLLHHHRPVERGYWTVGSQHLGRGFSPREW